MGGRAMSTSRKLRAGQLALLKAAAAPDGVPIWGRGAYQMARALAARGLVRLEDRSCTWRAGSASITDEGLRALDEVAT